MKRKMVPVLTLIFMIFILSMLSFGLNVNKVKANETIYIRANGSIDPPTANITSADNVTYTFTGNINDSIVVERSNIIIDGDEYTLKGTGGGTGIFLSGINNVTIKNMQVQAFGYGILLSVSSNNTIFGNNITNNNFGIEFSGSSNNTISGNNVANSTYGIDLYSRSNNNSVFGNNITDSDLGLRLGSSSGNFLHHNLMEDNLYGFDITGLDISYYLHSINTSNLVDGKPVYYLVNQRDLTINPSTHPEVGFLALINSANITVEGLTLTKKSKALLMSYTNDSEVQNNYITNNKYGIYLHSSSNNTISGNNITANERDGISLQRSSNSNSVFGNNIIGKDLYYSGILLDYSSNNSISENYITNYGVGFYVYGSSNNSISGDNIEYNYFGIYLEESSNNTFYHNNFIENALQVCDYLWDDPLDRSVNVWDYGFEGNYWSNYTEVDSDYDGIGDTSHVIDANNQDNYPLMGMFSSFNASLVDYVNVVSNSTIEDFTYFESNSTIKMHVSNMTGNQTYGFVRICIPHALMTEPYSITVNGVNPTYWNYTLHDNGTHRWIYFAYEHSTLEIVIVPEFQSLILLPLLMVTALLMVLITKGKNRKVHKFL